jgi:hypothetical protein
MCAVVVRGSEEARESERGAVAEGGEGELFRNLEEIFPPRGKREGEERGGEGNSVYFVRGHHLRWQGRPCPLRGLPGEQLASPTG